MKHINKLFRLFGVLGLTVALQLVLHINASAQFFDDFSSPTLNPAWTVVQTWPGGATRAHGNTSPGNHFSLTDNPGFLRYALDPMTHHDGFLNSYATTSGQHSCCTHDAGLEIHRTFSGEDWRFEAGGNFVLPNTNGRALSIRIYFGTGGVDTYFVQLQRGADVTNNSVNLSLVRKTGPAVNDKTYLQDFSPNGSWYYGTGNYPTAPMYFRVVRKGGVLTAYWSDNGTVWNEAWAHDLGTALNGLSQRVVVTGLSWFNTGGSYADWDYVSVTPITQTWIELNPTGTQPDPTKTKNVFYDAANNRLIVLVSGPASIASEVWILTNANGLGGVPVWSQLTTSGTPPTNNGGAGVGYDAVNNRLIVYGGCGANCSPALSGVFTLTNANGIGGASVWSQSSVTNPQARVSHRAIYNSTSNTFTTFGGHNAFYGTDQDDTRVLSNANGSVSPSTWSVLAMGVKPSRRGTYSFIYDEINNRSTLFAGTNLVSTCCPYVQTDFNDTWLLTDANGVGTPAWTQLNPLGSIPSVRSAHSGVYDAVNNRMLVFGGVVWNQTPQTTTNLGDLWELSQANGMGGTPAWRQLQASGTAPSPRNSHGAAFDAANQRMMILGGVNDEMPSYTNRLWVLLLDCLSVSIPTDLQALRNTTVTVPVNVSNTTGRGIISYDFTLNYNAAVMTPAAVPFDTTGTLSNGYTVTVNSSTPGTLVVSGFGSADLSGAGTLLNLKFDVIGSAPAGGGLNFPNFSFNEGTPCATTTAGMFQVINGTISGAVTYGSSMTPLAVPNVTMTAAGTPNVIGATNASGAYSLNGFGNGSYTVTPSKTGDVNNSITAFDAGRTAQHVVGNNPLTVNQQIAADVSNNGSISSFDAALISRYVVSLPNSGNTGTWKFVPVNRSYPNVEANQTNQDYTAILMGEVSGNWTPPSPFSEARVEKADSISAIGVSLPNQNAQQNSSATVPINVQDTTGMNVISYEFDLSYDPGVLQLQASPVDTAGTLSNGMSVTVNSSTAGLLRVAAFGANSMSGAGVLLNLKFTAIGSVGSFSPLTWQRFMFNEGNPQSATTNGQVTISSPTASTVSVSGRVTTANGSGVVKARVTLTDMNGETRTVTTNPFGYFFFTDVPAGETYIFSVSHKRYSFSPQVLTVTEETNNLNFIASDFW